MIYRARFAVFSNDMALARVVSEVFRALPKFERSEV